MSLIIGSIYIYILSLLL